MLTRRALLAGGLALAGAATCPSNVALAEPPSAADGIDALERHHNAQIGCYAVDLVSGRLLSHRAGDSFAMCSTFKVYAVARLLRDGPPVTDAVPVAASDILPNSPVTETRVGATMTYGELSAAALQRSDNAAANLLLRAIGGPPAVTEFARSIGDFRTRLDRWETQLNAAVPGDPRDTSTPEALGTGYHALLTGSVLAPAQRQQLEDWMRGTQTSSMRAGLPPEWTSADKTGSGDYGSTNSIGIAYGPQGQRLLLAMMTRSRTDDPNAAGLRPLIGELTALLVPELSS
jgi:beta-lactamase class A